MRMWMTVGRFQSQMACCSTKEPMLGCCHCPAALAAAAAADVIVMAVEVVVSQQVLRVFVILLLRTEAVGILAMSSSLRLLGRQCIQTEVACVKEREVYLEYKGGGVLNTASRSYVGSNKKRERERREKKKKATRINIYSNIWAVTFTLSFTS